MENKNNKGERERITKIKFKKRLKEHRIKKLDYAFKQQSAPCSCLMKKNKLNFFPF